MDYNINEELNYKYLTDWHGDKAQYESQDDCCYTDPIMTEEIKKIIEELKKRPIGT